MKVLITSRGEDANVFTPRDEGFDRALTEDYLPIKAIDRTFADPDKKEEVIRFRRVDYLEKGVVDLPPKQAKKLIENGTAEEV